MEVDAVLIYESEESLVVFLYCDVIDVGGRT